MTWTFRTYLGSRYVVQQKDMPNGRDTFYFAKQEAARALGVPVEQMTWEVEE